MPAPPRGAAAPAQQFDVEGGRAGCLRRQRGRRGGGYPPAGGGGAGHRLGTDAKTEHRHARAFRGELQPARRGEIESRRAAPALEQQRAQSGAARRIRGGAQQRRRVVDHAEQQRARVETELDEAGGMKPAGMPLRLSRAQPEQRRRARRQRQRDAEPSRARRLARLGRIHLVQLPAGEPFAQPSLVVTRVPHAGAHRGDTP